MAAPETQQTPDDTGRPLKPFLVLFGAQSLSLVGSQAVQFAIIWWLTAKTGSAAVLATATFFGLLPHVVLGPIIGALVDRWNRKLVMLLSDAVVALGAVALALLFLAGAARTEHVFALLFVRSVGAAFHSPAMLASTSLMVPERHLSRIQGLNQMVQGGLQIVSAPIGALLVGLMPMHGVMLVDVGTALIAIVPLLFIHVPQPEATTGPGLSSAAGSLWSEILAGVNYIRERSGHLALLTIATVVNLCMVPAFSLLPLLVIERGGDALQLGWLSSTLGVGTIVGGILLGVWGGFKRRILTTLAGLIGVGAATIALGAAPAGVLGAALGAIFGVGLMIPLTNGPIQAVLQATVAPEFQGRVFTLYGSLAGIATPFGLLIAAPVAEIAGVESWYYAGGLACIAMGATGFFLPSILNIEGAPEEACAAEA